MTIEKLIEEARSSGVNSRTVFISDTGKVPDPDTIGDWDAIAWESDLREIRVNKDCGIVYEVCMLAWLAGFWSGR